MTLRHLQIFLEVAETSNMSEAANRLFLSQPTVSQAIKDLEQHYGVLLFERRPKKLLLTSFGLALLEESRELNKKFHELERNMARVKEFDKIRIGATISVGNSIINSVIKDFYEVQKKADTFVCVNNTSEIEAKLLNDELDIGIIEGEVTNRDLLVIPAVNDLLVLVCNKNHPYAKMDLIPLMDLANQKFHLREEGSGTRLLFENFCKRHNLEIHCVFESNCPSAIKRSILLNDNLSVMSIRLCQEELKNGSLHAIIPPGKEWHRNLSLVYHKDKALTKSMKILMRIVKSYNIPNIEKNYTLHTLCTKIQSHCNLPIDETKNRY